MSDSQKPKKPHEDDKYSEETIMAVVDAMNKESEIRLMERENDRIHIQNSREVGLASMNHQAEYLKNKPRQQRYTIALCSVIGLLLLALLGWFYINGGDQYVQWILKGVFYLGSVYISYKVGQRSHMGGMGYSDVVD